MVVAGDGRIRPELGLITFADVIALAAAVLNSSVRLVILDMTDVRDMSTAALAHLVALRLELLERGRDIHLTGLHGRALALYHLTHMNQVLPVIEPPSQPHPAGSASTAVRLRQPSHGPPQYRSARTTRPASRTERP